MGKENGNWVFRLGFMVYAFRTSKAPDSCGVTGLGFKGLGFKGLGFRG